MYDIAFLLMIPLTLIALSIPLIAGKGAPQ